MKPRSRFRCRGFLVFIPWMALFSSLATAQTQPASVYQVGHIQVSRLRAPPTPPTAGVAAVYLWITNSGAKPDRLLAVSSQLAAKAEIHSSTMTQGVMQMRPVTALELPPGVTVKIEPGGLHIMLQGLKQPLVAGSVLPLALEFRDAGMLRILVPIESLE